jgi:hypothetical protein
MPENVQSHAPTKTWYARIPVELHGHQKKLDFFLGALERFAWSRALQPPDVSIWTSVARTAET